MSEIQIKPTTPLQTVIKRVEAIDIFKFIVLFFMIQGHLFRAYLVEPIRQTNVFRVHEILHGVVAPGFLFAAGFAVFLSFFNKREQYVSVGKAFFVRIQRTLFVIWCGYWVHMPFLSLRKSYAAASKGEIIEFLKVDILQCIGVSILLFTLIAVLVKNEKAIIAISGVMTVLFFALPSVIHNVRIWYVIDPYFDYNISIFPLFPWAGFLFLGIITAYCYTKVKKELFFRALLILGLLMFPWFFFHDKPFYVKAELVLTGILTKIGGVLLLVWLANWIADRFKNKIVTLMKKAGKESLWVYVLHLFIIFNYLSFRQLEPLLVNRLNLLEATIVFLIIAAAVFATSLLYNYLKEKKHRLWRIGFYVFWAVFFAIFIIRPY